MIVAAHQPNFAPYMGFFYKMHVCDIFAFSDTVQYSRSGYHNYNFICENGQTKKLTVPVGQHSGSLRTVILANWEHNRKKIIKRLAQNYSKSKYYDLIFPWLEGILICDYRTLTELNIELIRSIHNLMGFSCELVLESDLGVSNEKSSTLQIADLCKKANSSVYLSGTGAVEYLNPQELANNGIQLLWSNYEPLDYGSVENASVIDYLFKCGAHIPQEWEKSKEVLKRGIYL